MSDYKPGLASMMAWRRADGTSTYANWQQISCFIEIEIQENPCHVIQNQQVDSKITKLSYQSN